MCPLLKVLFQSAIALGFALLAVACGEEGCPEPHPATCTGTYEASGATIEVYYGIHQEPRTVCHQYFQGIQLTSAMGEVFEFAQDGGDYYNGIDPSLPYVCFSDRDKLLALFPDIPALQEAPLPICINARPYVELTDAHDVDLEFAPSKNDSGFAEVRIPLTCVTDPI